MEFGEKLLWQLPKQAKMAKFKQRWENGIFVGVRRRSGEFWVVDKEGKVQAVRSVRRIPLHSGGMETRGGGLKEFHGTSTKEMSMKMGKCQKVLRQRT